ncbi:MAG: DUF2797 domain-containing protein [Gammaproteobacteria bacterium]|nr:DUF2797 domain-containing protein [Gammaproteobacteria bacterium]
MKYQGHLHKMHVAPGPQVQYQLSLAGDIVCLNDLIGSTIRLEYLQNITCTHCGRDTSKSFNQGFCYPCFRSLAQCDICIISPEKCHYHHGSCREPSWGLSHCMQAHVIYLSNTSGIKVGITRESQLPVRWIDQGAVQALAVLRVSRRYHSGLVEMAFKQHVKDKTNWRTMLKNDVENIDLYQFFEFVWPKVEVALSAEVRADIEIIANQNASMSLRYPALEYPQKVTSFNFDKTPLVTGRLNAIKGQYLILDSGVINIRKFAGYLVSLEVA